MSTAEEKPEIRGDIGDTLAFSFIKLHFGSLRRPFGRRHELLAIAKEWRALPEITLTRIKAARFQQTQVLHVEIRSKSFSPL